MTDPTNTMIDGDVNAAYSGEGVLRKKRSSLLLSIISHLLIGIAIICLGAFTAGEGETVALRPGGIVLTDINSDSEVEYLTETDVVKLDTTPAEASASTTPESAAASNTAPELDTPEPIDLPGVAPPAKTFDANSMTESPDFSTESVQYELSQKDLDLIAKDQAFFEAQRPKGDPTTVSIFNGGGVSGRKFVFVIDRSHSMGGEGLGVLNRARQELIAAIDGLEENHEFQIVAYHDSTIVISERRLLKATPANKQLVAPFFENVGAFGATNHFYGLLVGLNFKPDVLMFMTDGGSPSLTPAEIKRVQKLAGNKTQIHCIEFGSGSLQRTVSFLKTIARQNQGSFRYIDVNKWRRDGR
jgi:hypothetical protein